MIEEKEKPSLPIEIDRREMKRKNLHRLHLLLDCVHALVSGLTKRLSINKIR